MNQVAPPFYSKYSVSPDGRAFLFLQHPASPEEPLPLVVVLNWLEELKAKMREAEE